MVTARKSMTEAEVMQAAHLISGLLKTCCGIANNAAWMACLEAYDKAKQHPSFDKRTSNGRKPKWYFKRVFEEFHTYERDLIYGGPPYFFRLEDLPPDKRKSFGNITDRDFYDMWAATGATAYGKTRNFVTCLVNKFRIVLEKHNVPEAETMAWVITASACLRIAHRVYLYAIKNASQATGIPQGNIRKAFRTFSLERVYKVWEQAEIVLDQRCDFSIDGIDEKNIQTGIRQIEEKWISPDGLYGSIADTFEDYDEVWRTSGEQKKAIRGILDIKDEINKCEEQDRIEYEQRKHA